MLIEVIPCLPVIFESPCLQILSFRLLGLLVRELSRMAPLAILFVLADLLVRLSEWCSFNDKARSEENPTNGIPTLGTGGERWLGHPLNNLKARVAMIAALVQLDRFVNVRQHTPSPDPYK